MTDTDFVPEDRWASLIINQVLDDNGTVLGYILVKDLSRHNPKWKLPGGHDELGERPLTTAMRENQGETGLRLPAEAYREIVPGREWRTDHWSFLFLAKVPVSFTRLIHEHDIGNEDEVPHYFTLRELENEEHLGTILQPHLKKLRLLESLSEKQSA